MHKWIITFSLFLIMGTLLILVHFTSITFPDVKAQEYGAGSYDYGNIVLFNQISEVAK